MSEVTSPTVEPVVDGNDWSVLRPEPGASWTPSRRVSICIPTRNPGPGLQRTLRCLDAQTYPLDLLEVVIGDDGSDQPITVPDGMRVPVEIARIEHTSDFGAGAARRAAAERATGDILVFLDADVIPERQVVEAYARWFERSSIVVPMGLCRFADFDGVDDDELSRLVADGRLDQAVDGADVDQQMWRERHFRRLDDLRVESPDAFRVTIGATIACTAEQYHEVGGFPALGVRGVEDTVFGHRLHTDGAVMVLDRDAVHWHQGRRSLSDAATKERVNEARAPFVDRLMPVRSVRRNREPGPAPVDVMPVVRAWVAGDDGPERRATIAGILARPDAEVQLADEVPGEPAPGAAFDAAFLQVVVPAGLHWSADTVDRILTHLYDRSVGSLRAVTDDLDGGVVSVATTRSLRRTRHTLPGASLDELLDEVAARFGCWWLDAGALALAVPADDEADGDGATSTASPAEDDRVRVTSRLYDGVVDVLRRLSR